MLSLKLNRNSWHYWLAIKLGWKESNRLYNYEKAEYENIPNDFCSYARRICFGGLGVLIMGIFVSAATFSILYLMGSVLGWFLAGIFHGFVDIVGPGVIGIVLWLFLAIFGIFAAFKKGWIRLPSLSLPACEDIPYCEDTKRFVVAAYSMFHDKVCFKLEFHTGETNGSDTETSDTSN